MVILGLLLLAAAAVLGVETALSNQDFVTVEAFNETFSLTLGELFLAGAATGAVALLGLWMIVGRLVRGRRHHTEARHRVRAEETRTELTNVGQTAAELAEENDRLRAELAAERRAAATMGGVAVPPGAGNVAYGDQVSDAVRSDTISGTGRFDPYPVEHGTDATVNTEAGRTDTTYDNDDTERSERSEHSGVTGRLRGNP